MFFDLLFQIFDLVLEGLLCFVVGVGLWVVVLGFDDDGFLTFLLLVYTMSTVHSSQAHLLQENTQDDLGKASGWKQEYVQCTATPESVVDCIISYCHACQR